MNTKTKTKTNLKRALLFFIPLCLIAGMFALPTFAVTQPAWSAVSGTLEPEEFIDIWGTSRSTAGMYAIRVTSTQLDTLLSSMTGGAASPLNFNIFGSTNNEIYIDGFACVETVLADKTWYNLGVYDGPDQYNASFATVYSGGDVLSVDINFPNSSFGYDRVGVTDRIMWVTFYLTAYPPDNLNAPANQFWNEVEYTVYSVSSTTPDPEPPAGGDDEGGEGDTSGIFAVWTQITDWIINGLKSATNAFYYNGQLTLLGYLCIIPLALGVALLLISIIQKFLRLRG